MACVVAGTTCGVACTTNMSVGWLLTLGSLVWWGGGVRGVLKTLGADSRCGLVCGVQSWRRACLRWCQASVITADGAKAFKNIVKVDLKRHRFKFCQVNHQRQEFVRATKVRFGDSWVRAGTQQLDSTWRHLKQWRPSSMPSKRHGTGNEDHFKWALSFQWRHNAKLLGSGHEPLRDALWR